MLVISIKDVGKTFQSLIVHGKKLALYADVAVNGVMICNGWHCLVDLSVMQKCEGRCIELKVYITLWKILSLAILQQSSSVGHLRDSKILVTLLNLL